MQIFLYRETKGTEIHGSETTKRSACRKKLDSPGMFSSEGTISTPEELLAKVTCQKCQDALFKKMLDADNKERSKQAKAETKRQKTLGDDPNMVQLSTVQHDITKKKKASEPVIPESKTEPTPAPAAVNSVTTSVSNDSAPMPQFEQYVTPTKKPASQPGFGGFSLDDDLAQFAVKGVDLTAAAFSNDTSKNPNALAEQAETPQSAPVDDIMAQFALPNPTAPKPVTSPAMTAPEPVIVPEVATVPTVPSVPSVASVAQPTNTPAIDDNEIDNLLAEYGLGGGTGDPFAKAVAPTLEPVAPVAITPTTPEPVQAPVVDDVLAQFSVPTPTAPAVQEIVTPASPVTPEVPSLSAPFSPSLSDDTALDNLAEEMFSGTKSVGEYINEHVALESARQASTPTASPVHESIAPTVSEPAQTPAVDDILAQFSVPTPTVATPIAPELPSVPEAASVPKPLEVPEVPDLSVPVTPASPEVPSVPEVASVPEPLEVPEVPDLSAPVTPASPEVPSVPEIASVPEPKPAETPQPVPTPAVQPIPQPQQAAVLQQTPIQPQMQQPMGQPMMGQPMMNPYMTPQMGQPQMMGYDPQGQPMYAYPQQMMPQNPYLYGGQPVYQGFQQAMPLQNPIQSPISQPMMSQQPQIPKQPAYQTPVIPQNQGINVSTIGQDQQLPDMVRNAVSKSATKPKKNVFDEQQSAVPVLGSIEDVLSSMGEDTSSFEKKEEEKVDIPHFREYKPKKSKKSGGSGNASSVNRQEADDFKRNLSKKGL